ncbi:MAG: hypothetical protein WCR05_03225 [Sphaerochaetaceae bacterium]
MAWTDSISSFVASRASRCDRQPDSTTASKLRVGSITERMSARFHFTDGTDDFARESIREEKSNPSASATGRFASSRARNAPLPQPRSATLGLSGRRSTNPSHRGRYGA